MIKADGSLNEKFPGGVQAQAAHLRREGHTVTEGKGKKPPKVKDAEYSNKPIYVLKSSTPHQMNQFLHTLFPGEDTEPERRQKEPETDVNDAVAEAEEAVAEVRSGGRNSVELTPQSAYVRRMQHMVAERNHLSSRSQGRDPDRRVRIYRG